MLIVDTPFPPYSPREYVYGGMPAVGELNELWSEEPETGLGDDAKIVKESPEGQSYSLWLVDEYQSRSDGKAAYFVRGRNGKVRDLIWIQKGSGRHRDGDLPAAMYFQPNGVALSEVFFFKKNLAHRVTDYASISMGNDGSIRKEFFLYDHLLSEDAFFKVHADAIKYNIPLWVALCKTAFCLEFNPDEDFNMLSEYPAEWVAKIIGLLPMDSYYVRSIFPAIQYEKDLLKVLVSETS